MSTWYYYDSNGQKQGPVTGGQLKGLAKAGHITPETMVETEAGKTAPARKVKGLTFVATIQSETVQPVEPELYELSSPSLPPSVASNPFSASAVNPFDTASPFTQTAHAVMPPFTEQGFYTNYGVSYSNTGPVWMYLTSIVNLIITLIIWVVIKDKHPLANIHGKNILNAFFSMIIYNTAVQIAFVVFLAVTIALVDGNAPLIVSIFPGVICVAFGVAVIWLPIRYIVYAIRAAIAAGRGEVFTYDWAIRFFKTD